MSKKNPSLTRIPSIILRGPYLCPSCSFKRAFSTQRNTLPGGLTKSPASSPKPTVLPLLRFIPSRYVSTSGSITAVHAPRSIPPTFRKLDQALGRLEKDAAVYVNISQLRLALRGLESENAVTRIASKLAHINPICRLMLMRGQFLV